MPTDNARPGLDTALARLHAYRKRAAYALLQPWEHPTLFPLEWARSYPRFTRGYEDEKAVVADITRVIGYTMTKYDRCANLHQLIRHLERIGLPGSLVECGVWRGGSAGIMALANLRYGPERRHLHLFDAFGAFPDPTPEDGECFDAHQDGSLAQIEMRSAREACEELLDRKIGYPTEAVTYWEGLFDDTVPPAAPTIGDIACLRLDGDWFNSTKVCLENLYDLVVPGGVVIVDDYGYSQGARRAVDDFLEGQGVTPYLHYVDYTCRYFFKP